MQVGGYGVGVGVDVVIYPAGIRQHCRSTAGCLFGPLLCTVGSAERLSFQEERPPCHLSRYYHSSRGCSACAGLHVSRAHQGTVHQRQAPRPRRRLEARPVKGISLRSQRKTGRIEGTRIRTERNEVYARVYICIYYMYMYKQISQEIGGQKVRKEKDVKQEKEKRREKEKGRTKV